MKRFSLPCIVFLLIFLFASCGSSGSSSAASTPGTLPPSGSSASDVPDSTADSNAPLHIPELTVELPRALDTTAARKAMEKLPAAMAEHQIIIDTVSVSYGPTYAATAAALRQGSVQLAFLPAADCADLGDMNILLADVYPLENGFLSIGISAQICAGPSDYGRKLAALAQDGSAPLTWSQLNQAHWGVLDAHSLPGYRCLRLWLEDNYEDNGVSDLRHVTVYDSWESLLSAAAMQEIDLFPLPTNADFPTGTTPFARSDGICTWVTAASPKHPAINSPQFQKALSACLNTLFSSPQEQAAAIGAEQYAPASSQSLNPLRRLLLSES